jgi:lipopolysaccharide export system protein LptA
MMPMARTSPSGMLTRTLPTLAALAALLGLLAAPVAASERDLPIRIQSDSATLDDQAGISVYRGNVIVTQGELVIRSDILTVHTPGRTLKRMEAEGDLATLRTLTEDGRELHAESLRMEYLAEEGQVVLTGRARIWQEADEFRGERLVYDLEREILEAAAGDNGRVEVIITPREPQ